MAGVKPKGVSPWLRHAIALAAAALLAFVFWRSRMDWAPEMRLWRAVGDAAFVLLALALIIGPLAVLAPRTARLVAWRRHLGVASALTAAVHAYLVWDGWALWSVRRFFGFQDLSEAGGPDNVLVDPGFGLANLVGLVALAWALIIAATSSDWAMRRLGARAWKYVQQFAYLVFYLSGLHAAYFLFLHYELSLVNLVFQKRVPDPNWARPYFVLLVVLVLVLQLAAFAKNVRPRKPSPAS
jgi:methionine sulfoxide reductase heme-binding subunit